VDYKEKFAVAYHLHSMKHRHAIGVKAFLPRENPSLPTVDDVWPAANFHEREAFDLFGSPSRGRRTFGGSSCGGLGGHPAAEGLQVPRLLPRDQGMTIRTDALPTQEMTINMGPQHPSTHGVAAGDPTTDGEVVPRGAGRRVLHRAWKRSGSA